MARTRYKLDTLEDIHASIQKVVNDLVLGKISKDEAYTFNSLIRTKLQAVKILDQEKELKEVKELIRELDKAEKEIG